LPYSSLDAFTNYTEEVINLYMQYIVKYCINVSSNQSFGLD